MKRRIISGILVMALSLNMSVMAFAAGPDSAESYQMKAPSFEMSLPRTANSPIKIELYNSEVIEIGLPTGLYGAGVASKNGAIMYGSSYNDNSLLVQTVKKPALGDDIYSARLGLNINNESAPKAYAFDFGLPAGYSLIKSEDFATRYGYDMNSLGSGLVYIIDDEGNIMSTIDEAWATDANGKKVSTRYDVVGDTLVQYVNFDEGTVFPVNMAPELYSNVKKKVESIPLKNTPEDRARLVEAKHRIDGITNPIAEAIMGTWVGIFGLFNQLLSIAGLVWSTTSALNQLRMSEYRKIFETLGDELSTTPSIQGARIDLYFVGTDQGKNKGYVYGLPTVNYVTW